MRLSVVRAIKGLFVFGVLAAITTPINAAIEFDNSSSTSSSADGATLSWSHTIGAGGNRMLIVGVAAEDTSQIDLVISSVKYNGVDMNFVAGSSVSLTTSTTRKTELYYLLNSGLPAPGTYTITVTYSGNVINKSAGAISLKGVDQRAREAVVVNSINESTTISTNITTLTNGAWVVDVIGSGINGTFTATGSGMTERWDVTADSSSGAGSTKAVDVAGTVTMSWQQANAYRLVHSVASFAASEPTIYPTGDLNYDFAVDWGDLWLFAEQWLAPEGCPGSYCADFDNNGDVNNVDFTMLAENWAPVESRAIINELMAANGETRADEYGDYDDWIEIYNPGSEAINIGGMFITDDLNEPGKWQIPANVPALTTIAAHGYLLLWADNEPAEGALHLGFKLGKEGEAAGLYHSDLTLADSIEFDEQYEDVSFGPYPDGTADLRFMGVPTPGAQNNQGYIGLVDEVDISHVHGFYSSPFTVELSCNDEDAAIKYTLDGNTPTETVGFVYDPDARIQITGTTCLRAAALKAGFKSSTVNTATYIFLSNVRNQNNSYAYSKGFPVQWDIGFTDYEMDTQVLNDPCYSGKYETAMKAIPTISIVTDMANLFDPVTGIYVNPWESLERPASIEYFDPCSSSDFQVNAGLRLVGNQSKGPQYTSKHSMRIFFKSEFGPSMLDFPLYPNTGAKRLNNISLRANYHWSWLDNYPRAQYLKDTYAQDSLRDMGYLSPDSRFVHVYIDGLYWGIYQASERADGPFLAEHLGGDREDYDAIEGTIEGAGGIEVKEGQRDSWDYMRSLLSPFDYNNPVSTAAFAEFAQHVDTAQFCDYIIYNTFVTNWDWCSKNWYAGSKRNDEDVNGPPLEKWVFYTWDAEISIYQHTMFHDPFPFYDYYDKGPGNMHNALHNNPEYSRLMGDRIHRHLFNNGALTAQKCIDRYQVRAEQIENAILGESARWGDFAHDFKDVNAPVYTPAYWDDERDLMVNPSHPPIDWWIYPFFPNRTTWLISSSGYPARGLYPGVAAPVFSQHGGVIAAGAGVTITGSETIYYTTDGREPKDYGTTISSGSSVTINNSLTLKARAYYSSQSKWSALNEATFAVGPVKDKLRITEIMFHPAEPNDPCQEFVELKNTGTTTLNLNLVKFTEGIHFTFPNMTLAAGDYALVVEDVNAFNARYGAGKNIAGQYTGSLDNGGERIRLEDAIGQTILDFEYKDGWRRTADGDGFSLNIFDANADVNTWGDESNWCASKFTGGTPDTADAGLLRENSIAINELMAHSDVYPGDWVELKNTTSGDINISGWYLSDDEDNLLKYQIKDGTVLAAGQYLVLSADANFGPASSDSGKLVAFAFSEYGETVYLTSSEAGQLTGYREKEDFGTSENSVAFGRHQKSTDTFNFVAMSYETPGAANAYPEVGPVEINEIMYNPASGGQNEEYIELKNITAGPVNLYDANGVCWKFTDGIDFAFPAGTTIPANGLLLVVGTTPAYFRTRYSVPGGVTVLGPYEGRLNNGGEELQLSKPGDIDESGIQQYIRVDRVGYSDGSHPQGSDPWPVQADGGGKSLSRTIPANYGNDPNNWQAANPSPGN